MKKTMRLITTKNDAIGPATGNSDLIFFISMIGEVLMVAFFYFYSLVYKADK